MQRKREGRSKMEKEVQHKKLKLSVTYFITEGERASGGGRTKKKNYYAMVKFMT